MFVHLNVHSEYSIEDGLLRVDEIVQKAAALQMPAVALTDQSNVFAQIKFYKAAIKAKVKPIFGADVWVKNEVSSQPHLKVTLLCMNAEGRHHLTCLISKSYTDNQEAIPCVTQEDLFQLNKGLLLIAHSMQEEWTEHPLSKFHSVFNDRFYLSISRLGFSAEASRIEKLLDLARKAKYPIVAFNSVRFLEKADFDAHEARVCIHSGHVLSDPARPRHYTENQYFKSPQEMLQLFADIPGSIQNTLEIAKRCNVHLSLGKVSLPNFPVPVGQTVDTYLRAQSEEGLAMRFDNKACTANVDKTVYQERLKIELDVIINMGFAGYFLIVADFIQWAKHNQIPVGPGRGSGAGSLVAFALQITEIDPLKYDLLFERFLNPERVSMPDFDIDFCMDRRDEVIDYVSKKYGKEAVSQIITFGTMAAKAVVRDVGRVLGHPYGFADRIAKLIPFEIGMTLEKALSEEVALRNLVEEEEEVKALFELARKLEGITRNAGKHAGGVVIAPGKLTDFTAVYCEPGSEHVVSQLDKDDVETAGLVKFDFLGLRTLTIIDWACKTIRLNDPNDTVNIDKIPLDDPQTFSLLKACATTAVFQLESRGMKDLIKRLQPDCFEDIVALVALFRPGPLQSGMVDDFIDRKQGRQKVEYLHSDLVPILKPTYGVILYQEQVMQIAQVISGYTLGGADLLRRAMGKKKVEEMAEQRTIFVQGAVNKGTLNESQASFLFDLIEKFAGYGFNKSHSAAYALVSYQTAWLKAHYPCAFMAAVLSADMDNTDKVVRLIEECKQMKIAVSPPDINHSHFQFMLKTDHEMFYGLGAIKGVGQQAIENILESRKEKGLFKDLFDFCLRIDLRKLNRRVLEALIKSGAMDSLKIERSVLMASLDTAIERAEQQLKDQAAGQRDLFFECAEEMVAEYTQAMPWTDLMRLRYEKETLGLYLTGHPLDKYRPELKKITEASFADLRPQDNKTVRVAGLLIGMRMVKTKQGKRMAILNLDDGTGRLDVTLFAEEQLKYQSLLEKDSVLVVSGTVSLDKFSGDLRMRGQTVMTLPQARTEWAQRLVLHFAEPSDLNACIDRLKKILKPHQAGKCPVWIDYRNAHAQMKIRLGEAWQVNLEDPLLQYLRDWLGDLAVTVVYN